MLAPTCHSDRIGLVRRVATTAETRLLEARGALGVVPLERTNLPPAAGRPGFILPGPKATLDDGLFWHGSSRHQSAPESYEPCWAEELKVNVEPDRTPTMVCAWEYDARASVEKVAASLGLGDAALGGRGRDWQVVRVELMLDAARVVRLVECFTGGPEAATWRTMRRTPWSRVLPFLVAHGLVAEAS